MNIFFIYYSLAAISITFIGSIVFLPNPYKIVQTILLAPVSIIFWLFVTQPQKTPEKIWSLRAVLVAFLLSLLGLFGYYLTTNKPNQTNENLTSQLESILKELSELKKYSTTSPAEEKKQKIDIQSILSNLKSPPSHPRFSYH